MGQSNFHQNRWIKRVKGLKLIVVCNQYDAQAYPI